MACLVVKSKAMIDDTEARPIIFPSTRTEELRTIGDPIPQTTELVNLSTREQLTPKLEAAQARALEARQRLFPF